MLTVSQRSVSCRLTHVRRPQGGDAEKDADCDPRGAE